MRNFNLPVSVANIPRFSSSSDGVVYSTYLCIRALIFAHTCTSSLHTHRRWQIKRNEFIKIKLSARVSSKLEGNDLLVLFLIAPEQVLGGCARAAHIEAFILSGCRYIPKLNRYTRGTRIYLLCKRQIVRLMCFYAVRGLFL